MTEPVTGRVPEPVTEPVTVVVGVALLDDDGRLLAARRSRPPELAGLWEFPGGKVEPGESETEALVRECREELGVEVRPLRRIGPEVPTAVAGVVLRVWLAELVSGRPVAREHAALRWLAPGAYDSVEWIPADAPVVGDVAALVRA